MRAWTAPDVPRLPVTGPAVRVHDTASGETVEVTPRDGPARLYVCGITPYDATHLGHAATYIGFDLLIRAWRAAGHDVTYVQNVTDVDDPLLERATKVGADWVELAERETELFRQDMSGAAGPPPGPLHRGRGVDPAGHRPDPPARRVGSVYRVDDDLYFSVNADDAFGGVSGWTRDQMLATFGERGGDPDRAGKKDPLDCVVWRAERPGEPAWDSEFGRGRPGWHIECTAIALAHLGHTFDVQGGGSDLVFPHHEMCASEAQVAEPAHPFARAYAHAGMVGYDGEKMSKSRGNLVFVSALRHSDVDPMAIRLALLRHHYRADWEWTDAELWDAVDTLTDWRRALALGAGAPAEPVVDAVLTALADDLDAPTALAAVQRVGRRHARPGRARRHRRPRRRGDVHQVLDAALGLSL